MPPLLETLILIALPASGKSEVRRYLQLLDPEVRRRELHLGHLLELDDFPYVHLMRRVDQELERHGEERIFYLAEDRSFREPRDWGTLIELLNQDHARLLAGPALPEADAAAHLLDRIDACRLRVGAPPALGSLPVAVGERLARALQDEVAALHRALNRAGDRDLAGCTLLVEFARGGPEGATMPLPAPLGYRYSLSRLAPRILERAAILYIQVTPEESRRKNAQRADPDDPGSILHHGVPEAVMRGDYGCDDVEDLLAGSDRPDTIRVEAAGRTWRLPFARFDNRVDRTSFLREEPGAWPAPLVADLHRGLADSLSRLATLRDVP